MIIEHAKYDLFWFIRKIYDWFHKLLFIRLFKFDTSSWKIQMIPLKNLFFYENLTITENILWWLRKIDDCLGKLMIA